MEMNELLGTTVHLLRGTRYQGAFEVTAVEDAGNGWLWICGSGARTSARPEDIFATEADARAEAKARRKPRTAKKPTGLYGDFALLAAFSGIKTDGTGDLA